MSSADEDSKNIDIPADVAEAWVAVILDLALKADAAEAKEREKLEAWDVLQSGARGSTHA